MRKVSSFKSNYDISLNLDRSEAYEARHKNINEVETCISGAAFVAISDWILYQDGIVYR